MKKLTKEQLQEILEKHKKWLQDEDGGERADLKGADLKGADLESADLKGVDLRCASLKGANLNYADLTNAKVDEEILFANGLDTAEGISYVGVVIDVKAKNGNYDSRSIIVSCLTDKKLMRVGRSAGSIKWIKEEINWQFDRGYITELRFKRIINAINFIEFNIDMDEE